MTKIDIISGFLGAGKTTLIKKLLEGPLRGKQVVLIENEFGKIGIDSGFLKETGIEIREMNQGCICCSLVGDFGEALEEVIDTYHPERIIIEPSGVGKLSDVVAAVKDSVSGKMEVNCATAVVDVLRCKMYLRNFAEFYSDQIEAAGTIILSRTDLDKATPEKIDEVINIIKEHNDHAMIVTTPLEQLDADKLLELMEQGAMYDDGLHIDMDECCGHEHHHHHDHDEECECGCGCHDHDEHEHHHHHHDHDADCECGCHDHEHHHHHHEHGEECGCGCGHDHGHSADEVFSSIGIETAHKFTREQLENALETLGDDLECGIVIRAKGMVPCVDGTWLHFDMVPEEYQIRTGAAEYTGKVVVIGSKIREDAIRALF